MRNHRHTLDSIYPFLVSAQAFALCALTALIGCFLILSDEVRESIAGEKEFLSVIDDSAFSYLYNLRTPLLNSVVVDITALGSGVVLTIQVALLIAVFCILKRTSLSLQIISVALTSLLMTRLLKEFFERLRPELSNRLVEVNSFSYPSGHSLSAAAIYLTMALTINQLTSNTIIRRLTFGIAVALIFLVATSRIYLGVHFLSDVIGGVLIGASLAIAGQLARNIWEAKDESQSV